MVACKETALEKPRVVHLDWQAAEREGGRKQGRQRNTETETERCRQRRRDTGDLA